MTIIISNKNEISLTKSMFFDVCVQTFYQGRRSSFMAHQCILACSPVLFSYIKSAAKEDAIFYSQPIIVFDNFSKESVEALLQFLYNGYVDLNKGSILYHELYHLFDILAIHPSTTEIWPNIVDDIEVPLIIDSDCLISEPLPVPANTVCHDDSVVSLKNDASLSVSGFDLNTSMSSDSRVTELDDIEAQLAIMHGYEPKEDSFKDTDVKHDASFDHPRAKRPKYSVTNTKYQRIFVNSLVSCPLRRRRRTRNLKENDIDDGGEKRSSRLEVSVANIGLETIVDLNENSRLRGHALGQKEHGAAVVTSALNAQLSTRYVSVRLCSDLTDLGETQ